MASNSRQARRIAEGKRQQYSNNYLDRLSILFNNSVSVNNLPDDLPKRYLLRTLLTKGAIAYDKTTKLFLPFVESGIDVYGLPQNYNLIGFNGFTKWCTPDEVVILRANDYKVPLYDYFVQQVEKLVDFDMAIEQNLEAIKTMTIAEVQDQATLLSIANEIELRRIGATVVYQNKSANIGNEIKVQSTGAEYLVDKLLEARKEILNETLSHIGLSVANVDKKERVQTAEINASNGYAIDSISTMVDTFNHDSEVGGLSIRLEANTSLMEDREFQQEIEKEGTNNDRV